MYIILVLILQVYFSLAFASIPSAHDFLHNDWIDPKISPATDFYAYANNNWMQHNPIPGDQSYWSIFTILDQKNLHRIHDIIKNLHTAPNIKADSIEQKIRDLYATGMDEATIEAQAIKPLEQELAKINTLTLNNLPKQLAHLHRIGVNALFNFSNMQDFNDSTEMIAAVLQGGLSLPSRDYYLSQDIRFKNIRQAFRQHIIRILELTGLDAKHAAQNATVILQIETLLAKASLSPIEQRNPQAIYHIKPRNLLQKMTPFFSWNDYLQARHQNHLKQLNVGMPKFIFAMNQALADLPIQDWKIYLRWALIDAYSPYLSQAFVAENFQFLKMLTGVTTVPARWKQVVQTENALLGFAIGELYVKKYFPPTAEKDIQLLVTNIRNTLRHDLTTLSWMSPTTRKAALNKLDNMEQHIGFPHKKYDYTTLHIDKGPYVLNVMRAEEFVIQREINKIGQPIDREEWEMPPQTINAYYDPSMNSINLPAGILQPPFFDAKAPEAINYGGIGFVIGHEITHGFDDEGAKFDAKGNLSNWWTQEDLTKFKAATQCIVNQFSQYIVNGSIAVQGQLVVGEATADLGGLLLAYRAYHASKAFKTAKNIGGFTPDQQFFISAAHIWSANIRNERLQQQVTIDPHPPAKYRINGTVANIPAFKRSFKIKPQEKRDVCVIW